MAVPGGYMQKGETVEAAAKRHCLQKAGIEIENSRPGPYTNNLFVNSQLPVHTVTLYVIAQSWHIRNQQLFESREKQWSWFQLDGLPIPQFLPLNLLQKQYDLKRIIQS